MSESIVTKTCTKCKIEKPLAEFHKSQSEKDGLNRWCKTCKREQSQKVANTVKPYAEKWCPGCKVKQPISEFYKNRSNRDGYAHSCKTCTNRRINAYRKTPRGKMVREGWNRSLNRIEAVKKYRQTEDCKKTHKKYVQKHPERRKAREAVAWQVRTGLMKPARCYTCLGCGKKAQNWHHHLGYEPEHWLDVIPVCCVCDKKLHQAAPCSNDLEIEEAGVMGIVV